MKTFKGLLIDNGVIKAGEFPVEPESFIPETEEEYNMALHDAQNELPQYMHREYRSALASAKANAVECEDQTLAATLMNSIKKDNVFILPSGWDYQVTEYTDGSKLAFLCHATEQPEPEESQEEPDWHNLFWQQRKSNLKPLPTFHLEKQMNNSEKCTLTDQELTEKVDKWVTDLTHSGGDKWSLRVPADHNHDPDFLFMEAVQRMNRYASRISELEAENKRLREEHRWIPVTERLPEDYERVLIFDTRDNHINIGYFVPSKFRVPEYNSHWHPLPSKPENK